MNLINKQNDINQFLIQFLNIIQYEDDKKVYIEKFLTVCRRNAINAALKTLSSSQQESLKKDAEDTSVEKYYELVFSYITPEVYENNLKLATQEAFQQIVNDLLPILPSEKKEQLQKFFTHALQ